MTRAYFYRIVFVEEAAVPVFTARPKVFSHRTGAAFAVSDGGIEKILHFCREYSARLSRMRRSDRSFCAFLSLRGGEKRRRHEIRLNDASFEIRLNAARSAQAARALEEE